MNQDEAQKIETQINEPLSEELTAEEKKDLRFREGEVFPYKRTLFEIQKIFRHSMIIKPVANLDKVRANRKAMLKAQKKRRRVKVRKP